MCSRVCSIHPNAEEDSQSRPTSVLGFGHHCAFTKESNTLHVTCRTPAQPARPPSTLCPNAAAGAQVLPPVASGLPAGAEGREACCSTRGGHWLPGEQSPGGDCAEHAAQTVTTRRRDHLLWAAATATCGAGLLLINQLLESPMSDADEPPTAPPRRQEVLSRCALHPSHTSSPARSARTD